MIFRVCEHYDDNQPIYPSCIKPDECFICYELSTNLEPCPISLKSQINYNKQCGCDGWIHKQCLDIWFSKQRKCPICRLEITERTNNNIVCAVVNVVPYSNRIYLFVFKTARRVSIIAAYCFLIYAAIEFYLSVTLTKHISRNEYNQLPYSESEFNNSII